MKKYREAVSILVLRGKEPEILVVHKPRKMDAWQLPQGGIETGETAPEAALRELKEETGLNVSIKHVSRQSYCYDFPEDYIKRFNPVNSGQKIRFVVAEADSRVGVKVDQKEVDGFRWMKRESLKDFIRRPEYSKVIYLVLDEYSRKVEK